MEFGTGLLIWAFLVFFFDMDGFAAIFWIVLISIIFYGGCSVKIDTDIKTPPTQERVERPKPKVDMKRVITFGVKRKEYIDNSKRSSETVEVFVTKEKTIACTTTCFDNPTFKRHLDNVLYACKPDICYKVKL